MHLLRQQQKNQLFYLFFILVTPTISIPIRKNIRCNILHQNCTFIQHKSSSNSFSSSMYFQGLEVSTNRPSTSLWSTLSTSRLRSTIKTSPMSDFDAFSENLKRAALILAGIALGLGILRICLMLCRSRSRRNSISNRHSATVRPQISTIERHQFKPDLPPAYAEAIANMENDGGKLPSYEELPDEQRREQHLYDNDRYVSTRM
jgi:hypothetical protein